MVSGEYTIKILKGAQKDKEKVAQIPALKKNVEALLAILRRNPYQNPPPYEKLVGNMRGMYSRRINKQHRLVYEVDETLRIVRIVSMWTHYE